MKSDTVYESLYSCVASALGFEGTDVTSTSMAALESSNLSILCSPCNGSECPNTSCYIINPVSGGFVG